VRSISSESFFSAALVADGEGTFARDVDAAIGAAVGAGGAADSHDLPLLPPVNATSGPGGRAAFDDGRAGAIPPVCAVGMGVASASGVNCTAAGRGAWSGTGCTCCFWDAHANAKDTAHAPAISARASLCALIPREPFPPSIGAMLIRPGAIGNAGHVWPRFPLPAALGESGQAQFCHLGGDAYCYLNPAPAAAAELRHCPAPLQRCASRTSTGPS